jgi:hypothetical protein
VQHNVQWCGVHCVVVGEHIRLQLLFSKDCLIVVAFLAYLLVYWLEFQTVEQDRFDLNVCDFARRKQFRISK